MTLKLFNTLTRSLEELETLEDGKVSMYACGPTVYNFAHIGNFRTFMCVDVLRRYLEYKGYTVSHAMNLTDIDDKTIKGSQSEGISLTAFTEKYTKEFFTDFDSLRLVRPTYIPKATDYISHMIKLCETLIADGHAYVKDGSVYFDILSFEKYGDLAQLNLEGLKENADGRLNDADEYNKDDVRDFALWKAYSEEDGDVFWDSPWGKGRPGWHIECSVMSMDCLGDTMDIHCGGIDLMFPHHTNEIAQSECASKKAFVKYWFHVEHLLVDGKKMSKSLGNFFTIRDLLEKGYSAREIRYVLMSSHYKHQLNFTFGGLDAARSTLGRFDEFILNMRDASGSDDATSEIAAVKKGFEEAMDDDLNISRALGCVFDFMRDVNKKNLSADAGKAVVDTMYSFDSVFGLDFKSVSRGEIDDAIQKLVDEREEARKQKDFERADAIRDELKEKGILLDDTPEGVRWKRVS